MGPARTNIGAMASRHVVAAGDKTTAEAARELLWLGGNAFDAAVGAVFTSMVSEPSLTSAGGGGYLMSYPVAGEPILYDFFVDMPRGEVSSSELDFFGVWIDFGTAKQEFHIGRGAVAVPGTVGGLLHIHRRLGALPLKEVLSPASRAAREGVELSEMQANLLRILAPILTYEEIGSSLFAPNGRLLRGGDRFKVSEFANFLDALGSEGKDFFYRGEVAQVISEWARNGGLVQREDLASYRVNERSPLSVEFADHTVLLNPPPAQSGALIQMTLSLLGSRLEAPITIEELVAAFRATDQSRSERVLGSTTHFSILDRDGNAASVTTTNGEGCGYVLPNVGFMLNNMLGEDDLNPGGFHQHAAGVRLPSMVAPTIVLKDGKPVLLTGSAGSKRIRSVIVQLVVNYLCYGMGIEEATRAPRIHLDGDTLHVEPGIAEKSLARLESRYSIRRWDKTSLFFGGANSVTPEGGAGDPRRGGYSMSVAASSTPGDER